jgi:small subunit ribosomal protein S2
MISTFLKKRNLSLFSVERFYTANVHFGHSFSEWNSMVLGSQHFLYRHSKLVIFNLHFNSIYLNKASLYLKHLVFYGGVGLLVDHDRPTANTVRLAAEYLCQSYLCSVWSGGTLTNFREVVLKNVRKLGKKFLRFRTKEYVTGLRRLEFVPNFVIFSSAFYSAFGVRECNLLNLPSIAISDSNLWANEAFFPIFGNDDAVSSVKVLIFVLTASFRTGRASLIVSYFNLINNFILRRLS